MAAVRAVELTHPDKVLFPAAGLTKADLARHYERVAPLLLPHARDRPLSLQVFHQGVGRPGHFLKNVPKGFPDWVQRIELPKRGGTTTYPVADDAATLRLLAQHNAVTLHAPTARIGDGLDRPDRVVVDLDPPDDGIAPRRLKAAVRLVAGLVEAAGLTPFLLATGSSGYHVVAPLVARATYGEVLAWAKALAAAAVADRPGDLTLEFSKDRRGGRIYADVLRNRPGATAVVPYSARARPDGTVATPLRARELTRTAPDAVTIRSLPRRLARTGDAWEGFAQAARPLPGA